MAKRSTPRKWTWDEKKDLVGRFLDLHQQQGLSIKEAAASLGISTTNAYAWKRKLDIGGKTGSKLVAGIVKKQKALTTPYLQLNSTNLPQEPTFTLTKRQLMDLINDLLSMRTGVA